MKAALGISRRNWVFISLILVSFTTLFVWTAQAAPVKGTYAATTWPTIHADSRNSDFANVEAPVLTEVEWTALDGAAVIAAVTIGPEGNRYITTGKGLGFSNLHAFDQYGNHLWSSAPVIDLDDLDAVAVGSSAIVDLDGVVYISDSNQFWAFYPDGTVKWVMPIPANFATAFFTMDRHVGGITVNGQVLIMDRDDGSLDAPILDLPGGSGPPPPPTPPGLWAGGLVDPLIKDDLFAGLLGLKFEVANTPAVNPINNRIYIAAAGPTPEEGTFYGIDLSHGNLQIAFQTPMGPGSGTSPAISPDGSTVYAGDGDGNLYAFDAYTGSINWVFSNGGQSLASPSIGEDGTIYLLIEGEMYALSPQGDQLWYTDFDSVASDLLPPVGPLAPIGKVNSVISVTPDYLYVAVNLGYEIFLPVYEENFLIPKLTKLLVLNPVDGSVSETPLGLRDTCDGVVTIGPDNKLYVTHGSVGKSIAYYDINPYIDDLPLPPEVKSLLKVDEPKGGLSALGKALAPGILAAQVYIHPDTLNLGDEGQYITCYIEMPEGYDALEIDVGTVKLEDTISVLAEHDGPEGDDVDGDGVPERMVKFDRQEVIDYLGDTTGDVILTVSGNLLAGDAFEGDDTICVINPGASAPVRLEIHRFAASAAYPQPANPELWIPYELGKDVKVTITIYGLNGQLIRTLDLGHQKAGAYMTRDKAAYWDGKDEAGEYVASGVYFYNIQAGEFTAKKKIVIAK